MKIDYIKHQTSKLYVDKSAYIKDILYVSDEYDCIIESINSNTTSIEKYSNLYKEIYETDISLSGAIRDLTDILNECPTDSIYYDVVCREYVKNIEINKIGYSYEVYSDYYEDEWTEIESKIPLSYDMQYNFISMKNILKDIYFLKYNHSSFLSFIEDEYGTKHFEI